MTTTEEIVVSGEDFIERRIFVSPEQVDIENLRQAAFRRGYSGGWVRGFVFGLCVLGLAVLLIWCASQW
jgi:hypothetical protein